MAKHAATQYISVKIRFEGEVWDMIVHPDLPLHRFVAFVNDMYGEGWKIV